MPTAPSNWYLFIHRDSLQLYAVSPKAYARYVPVLRHYIVVPGFLEYDAREDVARSFGR